MCLRFLAGLSCVHSSFIILQYHAWGGLNRHGGRLPEASKPNQCPLAHGLLSSAGRGLEASCSSACQGI